MSGEISEHSFEEVIERALLGSGPDAYPGSEDQRRELLPRPRRDARRLCYKNGKARSLLKSFVDLHPHAIHEKVRIMVEHFAAQVQHEIGGEAKAMIVTGSRLHAVRYKLAIDKYLAERGYPFKALVAFSGTVQDGGRSYTEPGMNGFPEAQTARTFGRPEYRFLIVANKFQTGFDQPLLHTMYVGKKLGGVNAVQTLSKLNRTHPEKMGTIVLDFANVADGIKAAFERCYETTLLSEGMDPNLLVKIPLRAVPRGFEGSATWYLPRNSKKLVVFHQPASCAIYFALWRSSVRSSDS